MKLVCALASVFLLLGKMFKLNELYKASVAIIIIE